MAIKKIAKEREVKIRSENLDDAWLSVMTSLNLKIITSARSLKLVSSFV
ncbi:hypothetical protein HLB03_06865 [Acidianus sp. DSM 29099]|nr:hypothetical protein [Acidianus sp. RZ1]